MKNALIITYYWPPSGGAGVQRWLKFVRYMAANGYRPVVLTVDPACATYPVRDESLLDDVPGDINIHYCKTHEPFKFYAAVNKGKVPYGGFANEGKPGMMARMGRFIRGNFFIPDARKGWLRYLVPAAEQVIDREAIDVVITSSPPHSTQLAGLALKEKLGIPWLADLRDPWTDIFYGKDMYRLESARKKDAAYERKVIEGADMITVVSRYMKKQFEDRYPGLDRDKINVITNGYDPDDFVRQPRSNNKAFIITYTGTMSTAYPIDTFLDAIQQLIAEDKTIRLRFIGSLSEDKNLALEQRGLDSIAENTGHVNHGTSVAFLLQSTALLLVIPEMEGNEGIVTGKIFEYLAARKPIIGIGPADGDASAIIEECQSGRLFNDSDAAGIKKYISTLYEQWENGDALIGNDESYRNYARDRITKRLCGLLDKL